MDLKQYEMYKHIGSLSAHNNGWRKERNMVAWNDREPVYDIRTWNMAHTAYGKGVTITVAQMHALKNIINEMIRF